MKINNKIKEKINNSVVRIIAEDININWSIPYLLEEPSKGQGTGFFINNKGFILTCSHVVNGSKNIFIEIPNISSKKYECDIISICPHFDIAIIRTKEYRSKDYLLLGDSDKLNVGDEVQVIGYPVSYKATANNINNLKYTIGAINGQQKGLIQTDSAINPGNSGGPLFCNNKVIGINSRKLVGESLENIGYAIPINNYKVIKNDIKQKIIYRPTLLFNYDNTNETILKDLSNNKINHGVIVSKFLKPPNDFCITNSMSSPNNNIHEDLIKKGSIITKINDIDIDNSGLVNCKWLGTRLDINIFLNKFKNNDVIKLKYFKDNKIETVKIKLEPFKPPIRYIYPAFESVQYFVLGGIIFMNLCINHLSIIDNDKVDLLSIILNKNEQLQSRLFVSFIFPNTKVNILNNIKKYDIICKVNDQLVNSVDQLKNVLNNPLIINNKEYIKIENNKEYSTLISVEDIIQQDLIFSNTYNYELNEFHKKYL